MALQPRTRIGSYVIVAPLGAGGMGEVYRATDTRLDRDVALKILPETFGADPDRLARLEREARTLASLNHPNIAQIYGIEAGAMPALVMELVEGEDLSARIARGAVPLAEAVAIAKQIAEALETAHEAGIVHRDLKPANIKVRDDGTVKVLDFGLAKPVGRPGEMSPSDATVMSPALTGMGVILGTAAYMAPEQATGRSVDKRADVWAFGVVLWEMLTGERLFAGDTMMETIASAIKDTPKLDRLPPGTPDSVRTLIARCLDRDPRLRLRDIGEARILLSQPLEPAVGRDPQRTSRGSWWLAAAAGMLVLLIVGAAAAIWPRSAPGSAPLRRLEFPASLASASWLALSPDGNRLAYVDQGHLYVRALEALEAKDLGAVHPSVAQLTWSPDGRALAFASEGTLRTIPADGGPIFTVCRLPGTNRANSALWRPDGNILFSLFRGGLYSVPATGGTPVVTLAIDPAADIDFHQISAMPDGRLIVISHRQRGDGLVIELVSGATRTPLISDQDVAEAVYVQPGHLLVRRRGVNAGLWGLPFTGGATDLGKATLIQQDAVVFTAAGDGTIVAGLPRPRMSDLVWLDKSGATSPAPGAAMEIWSPTMSLSPDRRHLAFAAGREDGMRVVIRNLDTGADTKLTAPDTETVRGAAFGVFGPGLPEWFPSGDRVVYGMGPIPGSLVVQPVDGSTAPRKLTVGRTGLVTPDGRTLIFIVDDRGRGLLRKATLELDGTVGTPQPLLTDGSDPDVQQIALSRDGRSLAFSSRHSSTRLDLRLTEFPSANRQWLIQEGAVVPRFSADGHEIFFWSGSVDEGGRPNPSIMSAAIQMSPAISIGTPVKIAGNDPAQPIRDFMPYDAGRLLAWKATPEGSAYLRVVLIQNWQAARK